MRWAAPGSTPEILHGREGDLDGARAAYRESLRVFPEYPFARDALARDEK